MTVTITAGGGTMGTVTYPDLVLTTRYRSPGRAQVHYPLGATRYPDVTLRAAGMRAGDLELFYTDRAAADAAAAMHESGDVYTLDDTDTGLHLRYVVPEGGTVELEELATFGRFLLRVGYQEVGP